MRFKDGKAAYKSTGKWLFVVGMAGTVIPSFLFAVAVKAVGSGISGVLNVLTPIFTVLISVFLFKMKMSLLRVLGVLLVFMAALYLVLMTTDSFEVSNIAAFIAILVATICYAVSGNVVRFKLQDIHPITISGISFVMAGIVALPVSGYQLATDVVTWRSFGFIALLSVFATSIASMLFYWLVQRTDAVFAASVSFIIPVIALMLGALNGEPIGWVHVLGTVALLIGVYMSKK